MEEQNNEKKGVVRQVVENEKQKAKKKILKKILIKLIPILTPLIVTCIIIGLIYAVVTTIINAISSFLGGGSNTVEQSANAAISLSSDGYNYIINDDYVDNIINSLEKYSLSPAGWGLTNTEYEEKYKDGTISEPENADIKESRIRAYIKAEVITMFPKIGSFGVDGIITVKRDNGEEGSEIKTLQYRPYNLFNSMVESGSESVQDYFSLNPSTFELCYATANIVERYNASGEQIERTVNLVKNEVNYQYLVSAFAMPTNFLVSTHMIAQNEDFMNDILNLQTNDAEIEIVLKDTVNIDTVIVDYSGDIYEKVDKKANYNSGGSTGQVAVSSNNHYSINNSNVGSYYSNIKTYKTVYIDKDTEILVTNANTWVANKENTYKKASSGNIEQEPQTVHIKEPENGEYKQVSNNVYTNPDISTVDNDVKQAIQNKGVSQYNISRLEITKSQKYDIIETTKQSLQYTEYDSINDDTNLDNVQRIIDLFNQDKYKSVKYNFYTNPDFYFLLLNKDEKTQNIEQVMRYILYKVTGVDYGVTDLDDLTSLFEVQMTVFSANDYVVKTDATNAAPTAPSKSELENALKKWLRTNSKMKSNALSVLDTVWQAQEQYKVNALFTYAYLRTETGIGIANTNYVNRDNNWGSWALGTYYPSPQNNIETITRGFANGGIYFPKNISVDQIGHIYCPNMPQYPTQGDDWVRTVNGYMSELYSLLGITIENSGGEVAAGGPGTLGTYKSGTSGRTFNLYLQYDGAWAGNKYGNSHPWTMQANGCGPTAAAIIASGYNGSINPETVRKYVIDTMHGGKVANYSSADDMAKALQGMNIGVKTQVGSFDSNRVKDTLKSGGQVWFVVGRSNYTNFAHCMSLIDYKENNQVYVAHGSAGGANNRPYGWASLDYIRSINSSSVLYVGGR